MVKTKRIRRTPEEARELILDAAQTLLKERGPDSVRLKTIAAEVGISHGTVAYHFKTAAELKATLQRRISRDIRQDLLAGLSVAGEAPADGLFETALAAMSAPERAPLLAWLIATGHPPFPDASERGLERIAASLADRASLPLEQVKPLVLLAVLAMFGDSLVGDSVRARLGLSATAAARADFRQWLIKLVSGELRRGARSEASETSPD